jgi:hypothetical protein
MSHYFTIPINTDGIITDLRFGPNLRSAVNAPFSVTDVFIYSHGWWTSASRALADYNQFTIEFAAHAARLSAAASPALTHPPGSTLAVAIHWPSMISDDDRALVNKLEPFSFYTMGHRANQVGANAVYALLRLLIQEAPTLPRLHFLGHSFGCRVVCAAIQEILDDRATIPGGRELPINAVLLEPAFDRNDLEKDGVYGGLCDMPNLRVLVTHSDLDRALTYDYPLSQRINLFKGKGGSNDALGGKGPTPQTIDDFGGAATVLTVAAGFTAAASAAAATRLVIADLTPLHQTNTGYPAPDHHSDIYLPEIYDLISGFLFR